MRRGVQLWFSQHSTEIPANAYVLSPVSLNQEAHLYQHTPPGALRSRCRRTASFAQDPAAPPSDRTCLARCQPSGLSDIVHHLLVQRLRFMHANMGREWWYHCYRFRTRHQTEYAHRVAIVATLIPFWSRSKKATPSTTNKLVDADKPHAGPEAM